MTRARTWVAVAALGSIAGAAALWTATFRPGGRHEDGERAAAVNVLLITIDTLRADRVGTGLTPAIDAIAARGVAFRNARTPVPLTLPAHATIMTGLVPPVHGVRENGIYRLDEKQPTLASLLRQRGYRTAAFVGAYVLDRRFGVNNGFETYDDRIAREADADVRLEAERTATQVVDAALRWSPGDAPFFMWVHLYDPHAPYTPPAAFLERARGNAYDGEVAYADAEVDRLIRTLEGRGMLRRTIVVIAGDHGEALGDHGERTHGLLLYDKALRVPLIVAAPDRLPARFADRPSTLADVAPTVLRLLRQEVPRDVHGLDLFADDGSHERETYSETRYPRAAGWSPAYALTSERWKLIQTSEPELYDLSQDPNELDNTAADHAAIVTAMQGALAKLKDPPNTRTASTPPDAEVAERLRALGYVASSPSATDRADAPNPARMIAAWAVFEDALSLIAARQPARAAALLGPLTRAHPDAPTFASTYAQALMQSGDVRRALTAFRQAIVRWPRDADLYHGLAIAARSAGRRAEALQAEQAAIVNRPDHAAAHNGLGLLAIDEAEFGAAADAFDRATALDPTNAAYWTNLGNARRGAGDLAGAQAAYTQALALDPSSADAANGLGVVLVQSGKPRDAIPWLERAVQASPEFYEAKLNLGIALQEAGRRDDAAAAYREVLNAPARFKTQRDAAATLLATLK